MYSRDFQEPRETPLERGVPIYGCWNRAFASVEPLHLSRPFALPLPKWMRDYRVKEWQSFQAGDDRYYLYAAIMNLKYYRIAQVLLYDMEAKEKLFFNKVLPFGAWRFPRELANASIASRSYGYYFRIHDWLDADRVEADIDIEPTRSRPSFTAHLEFDFSRPDQSLVSCLPLSSRRFLYSFSAAGAVRGDLVFGGRHIALSPATAGGVFRDYKGYYPYRMKNAWLTGIGFDCSGRRLAFSLSENQARDAFKYNENGFWLDGSLHLLPPVKVTQPNGTDKDWVIQDLEGMVDLTFTPREMNSYDFNLLLTRCEYGGPFGVFNGMLATSDGEKVSIRNLWGCGEKLYLRV